MRLNYASPDIVMSRSLPEWFRLVQGFLSCPHADTDGDCDSSRGEEHEHGV